MGETADPVDMEIICSRIRELSGLLESCKGDESEASRSDLERLVSQCAVDLEVLAQSSVAASLGPEDSSAFMEQLKEELNATRVEKIKVSDQIELLTKSVMADSEILEGNLEWLKCSLDHPELLDPEKVKAVKCVDCFNRDNQFTSANADACHNFEIMDLRSQIEKKNEMLKSLQSLDCEFRRCDIIKQIQYALSCIKVIEFDRNSIRLSLTTDIPKFESNQEKVEDTFDTSEVNHELVIEVVGGNLELERVEIFPNDVCIVDIVDAAKSFRQPFPHLTVPQTSLEWFVRKVQERIVISTLRRSAVKSANKLRYSAEYMERDDSIVVHFTGGIDAILKVSHGWPLSDSPLDLILLKYAENGEKRGSLGFLREVEEAANLLEAHKRRNLSGFLDAIEAMLSEQLETES